MEEKLLFAGIPLLFAATYDDLQLFSQGFYYFGAKGWTLNRLRKKIGKEEGRKKAMKYCAYQERCVFEVEQKLRDWGLEPTMVDEVIDDLVEQDFINEKRFTALYVRGKFSIKKWGRLKIRAELMKKSISIELIDPALERIDARGYQNTIKDLIRKKAETVKAENAYQKKSKIYYYLMSRGFEPQYIMKALDEVTIS